MNNALTKIEAIFGMMPVLLGVGTLIYHLSRQLATQKEQLRVLEEHRVRSEAYKEESISVLSTISAQLKENDRRWDDYQDDYKEFKALLTEIHTDVITLKSQK